jgi:hypothetical protein
MRETSRLPTPTGRRRPAAHSLHAGLIALAMSTSTVAGARMPAPPHMDGRVDPLTLQVTLGTDLDDGACGTQTALEVTRLDQVNVCYRVTNQSDRALRYHTLADDVHGTFFSAMAADLEPGATMQYNRIVTARESESPTATWTAYDSHPGYVYDDGSGGDAIFVDGFEGAVSPLYDFIDITAIGTPLDMLGDGFPAVADIGFPFTYYGQTSDTVLVSLNGGVLFGVSEGFLPGESTTLPNDTIGAAILPYWTVIYYPQPEDGNEYVATIGEAPNRKFVVEWVNVPILIGGIHENGATFEMVLLEGSNEILFQYADTDVGDPARDDGIGSTIGLNPPAGVEAALQYSYHAASVHGGKAIRFTPNEPRTYASSAQTTLDVGVPQITVEPAALDATANAGESATRTLTVGNVGNRDLHWKLASFAARSHFPPTPRFTLPAGDPSTTSTAIAPVRIGAEQAAGRPRQWHRGGVAAFAIEGSGNTLLSFDASNPVETLPVAALGDFILPAGEFVDEDFDKLYAIDWYSWKMYTIDTSTGAMDLVGLADLGAQGGYNWNGLAWDATTEMLYGVGSKPTRDGLVSFLYTIDPVTAQTTMIGQISGPDLGTPDDGSVIIDIAIDGDGRMYGIELVGDDFVAIDKETGEAAVISSLSFNANYAQSIDFDDYTGTLYYAAYDGDTGQAYMFTIDTDTGALGDIGPIGPDSTEIDVSAMAIARLGGVCAYPNGTPWLGYDPPEGILAAGEEQGVTVTMDAADLAPGTYEAYACVSSNDRTRRRIPVPVTLTVQ